MMRRDPGRVNPTTATMSPWYMEEMLKKLQDLTQRNAELHRRLAEARDDRPAWWVWHLLDEPEPPAQDEQEGEQFEEFDEFVEKAKQEAERMGEDPSEVEAMADSIKDTFGDEVDDITFG